MFRCAYCPIGPDLPCRGEQVRRLCQLIDPEHPAYSPGYLTRLLGTEEDRLSPDDVIARVEEMGRRAQAGERGGGCGGCP